MPGFYVGSKRKYEENQLDILYTQMQSHDPDTDKIMSRNGDKLKRMFKKN